MMWISKIIELDEASSEAELIVTDGNYSLLAFTSFFNTPPQINIEIEFVTAFMSYDVEGADEEEHDEIRKVDDGHFAHEVIGNIVEGSYCIEVGEIRIQISDADGFPSSGRVRFKCRRFDVN